MWVAACVAGCAVFLLMASRLIWQARRAELEEEAKPNNFLQHLRAERMSVSKKAEAKAKEEGEKHLNEALLVIPVSGLEPTLFLIWARRACTDKFGPCVCSRFHQPLTPRSQRTPCNHRETTV